MLSRFVFIRDKLFAFLVGRGFSQQFKLEFLDKVKALFCNNKLLSGIHTCLSIVSSSRYISDQYFL